MVIVMGKKTGFSVVELVIAMGIVIILSGSAMLYYPKMVAEAQTGALNNNLKTIRKVIDDFYGDFGRFPVNLAELTKETPGGYVYLSKIPDDPTIGMAKWEVSENGIDYYDMNDSTPAYVKYVRSSNSKYRDY